MKVVLMVACILCAFAVAGDNVNTSTNGVRRVNVALAGGKAKRSKPSKDGRCEAITKSGNRCKRKAVAGERYCRQHLKMEEARADVSRHEP